MKSWKEAQAAIPRVGPAANPIMASAMLKDGTPIFVKKRMHWSANAKASKIVGTAYDLCNGFVGENGGPVTHQMVAMFSYAVQEDNAASMTKGQVEVMTAGYEEDSNEWWRQEELGKKFPTIKAAILSFF